jgi:hypothetical protein
MGTKVILMAPVFWYGELRMEYTGAHENDFTARG